MAGKKENLKGLFTNTRTRVIIIFTLFLLLIAILVGVFKLRGSEEIPEGGTSVNIGPGGIQSIPGQIDQTVQYAKLQQEQNVNQAQTALQQGVSAIPTIIRSQALGQGVEPVGVKKGGGVGFATLSREDEIGTQRSLWIQSLQNKGCNKVTLNDVLTQGATLTDIKGACTCVQLRDHGYQIRDLEPVCSCKELRAAGFNARQLKDAGFSAGRLKACGFDACALRNSGFTSQEMKDGGYSDGELKGAGFSEADIAKAGGLPEGIKEDTVRQSGCQAEALKSLKTKGVAASAIRRISGCGLSVLKAAGFNAQDLKNAGFSAADLRNAGFTPQQLKTAGFPARELLNAGFTPSDLINSGFSAHDLQVADNELPPGVTVTDVKRAGCLPGTLKKEHSAGVSAKQIKEQAGCSVPILKAAGFSDAEIIRSTFTPQQLLAGGLSSEQLVASGISLAQVKQAQEVVTSSIKNAGCDTQKLSRLFIQGVAAKAIQQLNGCGAQALKKAGFDEETLSASGFSPDQVAAATGLSDTAVRAAGCDATKLSFLKSQGVHASRIRQLNGCAVEALKNAGFPIETLIDACFPPEQLLKGGFTPSQLQQTGLGAIAVIAAGRTAGCSPAALKAAKATQVSAATLRETLGCDVAGLKAAGYLASELRAAGFSAADLKKAGFNAQMLKTAGFSAKELAAVGFSPSELKQAGFSISALKDAGISASTLKEAGFSAQDLKNAGFEATDLKQAGFSANQLKAVGFTAKHLKEAGFQANQLKTAGYSDAQLQEAGFPGSEVSGLEAPLKKTTNSGGFSLPPALGTSANSLEKQGSANAMQLQSILNRQNQMQNQQLADQQYQQKIQERLSQMVGSANQSIQAWQSVSVQTYVEGSKSVKKKATTGTTLETKSGTLVTTGSGGQAIVSQRALIKTGDVLFAVLDTSVNSDEPGPILATIVSGRFKGAKLIGSFNLPANADKMVISFNTISVLGAPKATSINAYAIDPNTARTALASKVDHHYLLRYGSLFASSFLQGFGNAFQSANTTVTIGGTGGGNNITVQNGIGRSALQNAVIGLATLGKSWSQVAQQQFSTPTTVEICSGTGIGVLFTQDLMTL